MNDSRERTARLLAQTPFAIPRAAALELIEKRKALLTEPVPQQPAAAPEPVPEPEPVPVTIVDAPHIFADDFWKKRSDHPSDKPQNPKPKPKPRKPPKGRRPIGDQLDDRHDKFTVIEGDGDKRK